MSVYETPDTPEAPRDVAALLADLLEVMMWSTGYSNLKRAGLATRANANVYAVEASTTPVILLEANANRRGAAIYNDSGSPVTIYVKLGDGADSDDFSVPLAAGDYYEIPAGYAGQVSAAWSTATGQARVTEFS